MSAADGLFPVWAARATLVMSALLAVSSLAVLVFTVREGLSTGLIAAWFAAAFAVVVLVGGVMGVLTGMRRLRGGEPLTLLCIGGMVFISTVLSDPSLVTRAMGRGGQAPVFSGVDLGYLMLGQLAVAMMMVLLAAVTTLRRDPARAVPTVTRGIVFALPVVLLAALWVIPTTRQAIRSMPSWAQVLGAFVAMGAVIVCGSASIHYLIRGFAFGAHGGGAGGGTGGGTGGGVGRSAGPVERGAVSAQE